MSKVVKTVEEIRERDREYHRRKYDEKLDENRAKARERYYAKKTANPGFCSKPRGRPRKVAPENVVVAQPANPIVVISTETIPSLVCEF
jgi:hypothetical protein